jgi:Ca2+-binding EF-hand superfamily protein
MPSKSSRRSASPAARKKGASSPVAARQVDPVAPRNNDKSTNALRALYAPMFRQIDTDNSGYIDAGELYRCVSNLFPQSNFTIADIREMVAEADTNMDGSLIHTFDHSHIHSLTHSLTHSFIHSLIHSFTKLILSGVISMDEFVDVLANAEGKTSLWSQTQASIWQNFQRNTAQIGQVIDTTTVVMLHPLHNISRQNSYQFKDVRVATVGLRICTFLVALMIGVVTAPLLLINCLLILVNLFTMIGYGCTTEMYIMGLRLVDLDTRRVCYHSLIYSLTHSPYHKL